MRKILVVNLFLLPVLFTLPVAATPPPGNFKKAIGRINCEANPGDDPCNRHETVTVELDPGMVIDTSYKQTAGYWCCADQGKEIGLPQTVPGLYVEVTGNDQGVRYIRDFKLTPDPKSIDKDGSARKWIIETDAGCAPRARGFGYGGCNTNGAAWVKQIPKSRKEAEFNDHKFNFNDNLIRVSYVDAEPTQPDEKFAVPVTVHPTPSESKFLSSLEGVKLKDLEQFSFTKAGFNDDYQHNTIRFPRSCSNAVPGDTSPLYPFHNKAGDYDHPGDCK